jgi:hypothetical protein
VGFLAVAVSAGKQGEFPDVRLKGKHLRVLEGGEFEALVPMKELNPSGRFFDRIVFRAAMPIDPTLVELDTVGLWSLSAAKRSEQVASAVARPAKRVDLAVSCDQPTHPISDMIYGIAYYPQSDAKDQFVWSLNPGARRWGGNHTSRYNWKLGNAWNTASDWFFKNVNYTSNPQFTWTDFLTINQQKTVKTALTVPTLGWVAKDTSSYAFPVSVFGPQQQIEPGTSDVGNGVSQNGKPLQPGPQSRTSVSMSAADIEQWVRRIRDRDAKTNTRSVAQYILDNEPELWHVTHRDVHPDPLTYDELRDKLVSYAKAIRRADPQAVIAGPASWGWTGYFWSAADQVAGFQLEPDRRKHGDVPFLAWILREMRKEEQRTGTRLLDVLDVHFYSQGDGVYSPRADVDTAARRLRATRSLWDPSYRDESWINEAIELLPRFMRMINENYPGTKMSIGEWNFGGEGHISGALATAETLGRFGQSPIMASAYYWVYPANQSPSYWAFRAFRNYDGKFAHFLEESVPTQMADDVSLYASRDSGHNKYVVIAINMNAQDAIETSVKTSTCGNVQASRTFRMSETQPALKPEQLKNVHTSGTLVDVLPPQSITVYELEKK